MAACLRFTRRVWKSFLDNKGTINQPIGCNLGELTVTVTLQGHDTTCFPNLVIERATPGTVHASLKIEDYNLNRVKTVHGGLICSLTDTLGSLAVATKGHYMTGVSTDIGTSFVKAAGTSGDTLYATATVTGLGRSLAYTRVEFMNTAGQLLAFGHHTKFIGKSHGNPNNVKFSVDGEKVVEGDDVRE